VVVVEDDAVVEEEAPVVDVEEVEEVEVDEVGEDVLVLVPVVEARRDFNSVFSFLVSVRLFSRESMCILNSTFMEESFAIFCTKSWFSVINPFVLSSRSVIYSFLRCLERAADCLFFNSLSCLL